MAEGERLFAAGLCMEGKALSWFQWRENRFPLKLWVEFRESLLERFTTRKGTVHEQFFALTQQGSVQDYLGQFEAMAGRIKEMSEEALEGNFMRGLKPSIRHALRILEPQGLKNTMRLALLVEEKEQADQVTKNFTSTFSRAVNDTGANRSGAKELEGETSKRNIATGTKVAGSLRRMTDAELQSKRARGLCYRCDEKYEPGHRCKDRSLQVLLVCEENEEAIVEEELLTRKETTEHLHLDAIEVSLHAVAGLTPSHAMKMKGKIGLCEVLVLIDSGATHSFISPRVIQEEGLEMDVSKKFHVVLGNWYEGAWFGAL